MEEFYEGDGAQLEERQDFYLGGQGLKLSCLGIGPSTSSLRKIVQARCPRLVKFGPGR